MNPTSQKANLYNRLPEENEVGWIQEKIKGQAKWGIGGFVESKFPVFVWSFWEELAIWPSDLDEASKNGLALKSQT